MKKLFLAIVAIIALQSLREGKIPKTESVPCDIGNHVVTVDVPRVYECTFGIAEGIALAGVIAGTAGSVAASEKQKSAQRRMQEALDAQARRNRQHSDTDYYDNSIERAKSQSYITQGIENLRRQLQAEAGKQMVVGGTNAESAAAKEAANNAHAKMMSNVIAEDSERKASQREKAFEREQGIASQKANLSYQADQAKIANTQSAINAVAQSANAVGAAFSADGGTTATKASQGATESAASQAGKANEIVQSAQRDAVAATRFNAPTRQQLSQTMAENMTPSYLKFKPDPIWNGWKSTKLE